MISWIRQLVNHIECVLRSAGFYMAQSHHIAKSEFGRLDHIAKSGLGDCNIATVFYCVRFGRIAQLGWAIDLKQKQKHPDPSCCKATLSLASSIIQMSQS